MFQKSYRVLLLEDSLTYAFAVQKRVNRSLGSSKIFWTHSTLLRQALDSLEKNSFHLIVSDLSLPDGNTALDTVRKLKEKAPQTPLIVLTGFLDLNLEREILSYGIQDYLIKGENDYDLPLAISQALEDHENEKILAERKRIGKKQLLILEREEEYSYVLKNLVENPNKGVQGTLDCEVFMASSDQEAKTIALKHTLDIVILDLDDPEISLGELISFIRKSQESYCHILALSSEESTRSATEKTYDSIFTKSTNILPLVDYLIAILKSQTMDPQQIETKN